MFYLYSKEQLEMFEYIRDQSFVISMKFPETKVYSLGVGEERKSFIEIFEESVSFEGFDPGVIKNAALAVGSYPQRVLILDVFTDRKLRHKILKEISRSLGHIEKEKLFMECYNSSLLKKRNIIHALTEMEHFLAPDFYAYPEIKLARTELLDKVIKFYDDDSNDKKLLYSESLIQLVTSLVHEYDSQTL